VALTVTTGSRTTSAAAHATAPNPTRQPIDHPCCPWCVTRQPIIRAAPGVSLTRQPIIRAAPGVSLASRSSVLPLVCHSPASRSSVLPLVCHSPADRRALGVDSSFHLAQLVVDQPVQVPDERLQPATLKQCSQHTN